MWYSTGSLLKNILVLAQNFETLLNKSCLPELFLCCGLLNHWQVSTLGRLTVILHSFFILFILTKIVIFVYYIWVHGSNVQYMHLFLNLYMWKFIHWWFNEKETLTLTNSNEYFEFKHANVTNQMSRFFLHMQDEFFSNLFLLFRNANVSRRWYYSH